MDTYLTFIVGNESFAVPVHNVLEVLQKQFITRVPKSPLHVLGIINFRGDILPVFDTRLKFNLPSENVEEARIVIVFELKNTTGKTSIAATADTVKDVITIHQDEIKTVPKLGLNFDSRFITGAIRRNENFILLLDTEKVFLESEIIETQN